MESGAGALAAPRIGILIVAYNAASTLAGVLDRIPQSFRSRIAEVIVSDDSSADATYLVGLGYKQVAPDLPLTVIRNEVNRGYGGNQKVGYRLAIEHELDIIVLLHGDGQYAPEALPDIVAPLESGEYDAVLGSRMMTPGAARRGGMPLYKWVGNRILTTMQNAMLGMDLTEFHSGYRAYSVRALQELDFDQNSDGFDFDTEIIIQLHDRRMRIKEVPIPTYYGDEICYVDGVRYARDVMADVLRYRMSLAGPSVPLHAQEDDRKEYTLKHSPQSSHGRILRWLRGKRSLRILDLGCSSGLLSEEMEKLGHEVTGVDLKPFGDESRRMHRFIAANLDEGIPLEVGGGYDAVIAADVLEHVRRPDLILTQISEVLAPGGLALVSIPNFVHWYPRIRVALGRFDYDDQGILDRGHVRFFTRRSFENLARGAGLRIHRVEPVGVPIERLVHNRPRWSGLVEKVDRMAAGMMPNLFAYQLLFELAPDRPLEIKQRPAEARSTSPSVS